VELRRDEAVHHPPEERSQEVGPIWGGGSQSQQRSSPPLPGIRDATAPRYLGWAGRTSGSRPSGPFDERRNGCAGLVGGAAEVVESAAPKNPMLERLQVTKIVDHPRDWRFEVPRFRQSNSTRAGAGRGFPITFSGPQGGAPLGFAPGGSCSRRRHERCETAVWFGQS